MNNFQLDLITLLKARNSLIWCVTPEEARAEQLILDAAAAAKYPVRVWDCVDGIQSSDGKVIQAIVDPVSAMRYIAETTDRCVYILRDLHRWQGPIEVRSLRSLAKKLLVDASDKARTIIVLTPSNEIPPELASATVVDLPLPDREEIGQLLDDVLSASPGNVRGINGLREAAIDSAVGLSAEEVSNCYARSLVSKKAIDPAVIVAEKKRVIAREKVLTWIDPDLRGMSAVGGLEILKKWLTVRRTGFSQKAKAFGLPAPRGVFLVGISGCGKSLTAKCVASAWSMPLLRLDMGGLKSKYVGDSEQNVRKALKVAEAVSPCVLWIDEIEKALAGASGPQGDGGVSSDALGVILTWMQERAGSVFVVATANQVESLPPELLRKGRFDEMFFVDLPTNVERAAIISATLAQYKRDSSLFDLPSIASATDGFTGSEIASLVPEAMFAAFSNDERELTTEDLLAAATTTVPLSKTASDKIEALRKWANGRARNASASEVAGNTNRRALDI